MSFKVHCEVNPWLCIDWMTEDLVAGYCELNRLGFAHSFEAWQGGRLVGGFYGVAIGACFFTACVEG